MPYIKALLWRVVYAVIIVVVLTVIIPLMFQLVGIAIPSGPEILLLKYAFAFLVLIYVFFGPEPPAPF
jgi:hypothetical protein